MVPSLTEIILLIVIVICIFGLGKLGDISEALGEMRAKRARSLPGPDAVDITPEHQRRARASLRSMKR
jgi:Sec-independent protein translocase protein TatA